MNVVEGESRRTFTKLFPRPWEGRLLAHATVSADSTLLGAGWGSGVESSQHRLSTALSESGPLCHVGHSPPPAVPTKGADTCPSWKGPVRHREVQEETLDGDNCLLTRRGK